MQIVKNKQPIISVFNNHVTYSIKEFPFTLISLKLYYMFIKKSNIGYSRHAYIKTMSKNM